MKNRVLIHILVLSLSGVLSLSCEKPQSDFSFHAPISVKEPSVLWYRGTYYAYGAGDADGIAVYTSSDMMYWKKSPVLALDKADSYGSEEFGSPDVHYVASKGLFYMYYTADNRICVATSASPLGPFRQNSRTSLMEDQNASDPYFFRDTDGVPYLYYTYTGNASEIRVARLYDNLEKVVTSSISRCISVSQSWEVRSGTVNEAPSVIRQGDLYYMTYSANTEDSGHYGVGYAVSDAPDGVWTKFDENPILQYPAGASSVGQCSFFEDADGSLKSVLQVNCMEDNYNTYYMYFSDAAFSGDKADRLVLSSAFTVPCRQY